MNMVEQWNLSSDLKEKPSMPLSISCQQSWLSKEAPLDPHLTSANVMIIYKKEDLGNYSLLDLVLGKVMEQIISSVTTCHVQDSQGMRHNQHWLMKSGPAWPAWSLFCDQVTRLVDEEKAADVVIAKPLT